MRGHRVLLGALFLAGLLFALRHDLALFFWSRGRALIRSGDYRGAARELEMAQRLGEDGPPLAFDRGIASYRTGDFAGAATLFASSSAIADASAWYNRSNALVRLGESEAKDAAAVARLLKEAEKGYLMVLAREPGATDARRNLALVRGELTRLLGKQDAARSGAPEKGEKGAPSPAPAGRGDGERREEGKGAPKAEPEPVTGDPSAGKGRRSQKRLSREEAELLVGEARGRELPLLFLPAGKTTARGARPEKEW